MLRTLPTLIRANRRVPHIRTCSSSSHQCEEIRIPMPWGQIAAKWWGPHDQRPIITTHGLLDNCGSFDTLIPLLPKDRSFLAVDSIGHGLTTQKAPGLLYYELDVMLSIREIMKYFNWSKVSFLGHSMGGIASYVYTLLYPNNVDFLITIEGFKPFLVENRLDRSGKDFETFYKLDYARTHNKNNQAYTIEQLEELLHNNTRKSIALDKTKYLLAREIKPEKSMPNTFHLTTDFRLRVPHYMAFTQKDLLNSAHKVTCPFMFIKADKGPFIFDTKETYFELVAEHKKTPNFELHLVEGNHHVHLNHPERVAGLINDFLKKHDVVDKNSGGLRPELIVKK